MTYDDWKLMTPEEDEADEICYDCGLAECRCMAVEARMDD